MNTKTTSAELHNLSSHPWLAAAHTTLHLTHTPGNCSNKPQANQMSPLSNATASQKKSRAKGPFTQQADLARVLTSGKSQLFSVQPRLFSQQSELNNHALYLRDKRYSHDTPTLLTVFSMYVMPCGGHVGCPSGISRNHFPEIVMFCTRFCRLTCCHTEVPTMH